MSLLRYLKRKDGLLDPKASLTSKVPTGAIVRANRKVEAEMVEQKKKRDPYRRQHVLLAKCVPSLWSVRVDTPGLHCFCRNPTSRCHCREADHALEFVFPCPST